MSRNFELLSQSGQFSQVLHGSEELRNEAFEPQAAEPMPPPLATLTVQGPARDQVFKLVRNLCLLPGASERRRIVFTGTESGSGCSWISARAAEVLASQTRRAVCIVDCHLRSPSLHHHFEVPNHHGLGDCLLHSASVRQCATQLSQSNLWLLTAGSYIENCDAHLASDRMRLCLDELYAAFDYVLLDTAALTICNDAISLGSLADGVVLVLKANSSRRETARKALQDLQAAKVKSLGAVLNQRTYPIPEFIYKLF